MGSGFHCKISRQFSRKRQRAAWRKARLGDPTTRQLAEDFSNHGNGPSLFRLPSEALCGDMGGKTPGDPPLGERGRRWEAFRGGIPLLCEVQGSQTTTLTRRVDIEEGGMCSESLDLGGERKKIVDS